MKLSNMHTHTTYSDGDSTMEECVKSAIDKGFVSLGFSDHSPIIVKPESHNKVFDVHLSPNKLSEYISEITMLREKYKDKIELYIGIEDDYYPPSSRTGFNYVIGAVHFLKSPSSGRYCFVDYDEEKFAEACVEFGSAQNFVEAYYGRLLWIIGHQQIDVVAHIDLVMKLNKDNHFFNPTDSWYNTAVNSVLEVASKRGVIIELNSGAISRGSTDFLYPNPNIMEKLLPLGIPIMLNSDSHHASTLDAYFPEMIAYAKEYGYKRVKQLRDGEFRDTPLL